MAKIHNMGPALWQFVRLSKDAPIIHTAPTTELEEPYRESTSLVLRLPFGRGLVIGWWHESGKNEFEALASAINYKVHGYLDDDVPEDAAEMNKDVGLEDNIFASHTWVDYREDSANYRKAIQVWNT